LGAGARSLGGRIFCGAQMLFDLIPICCGPVIAILRIHAELSNRIRLGTGGSTLRRFQSSSEGPAPMAEFASERQKSRLLPRGERSCNRDFRVGKPTP
jgi:hypothetical protein